MEIQPTNVVDQFIDAALIEAKNQLGLAEIRSLEDEARQVERAIDNLAILHGNVHLSILKLMWRMERDGLYHQLGYEDMVTWALTRMPATTHWKRETIDRYAKAITRILPEVDRKPYVDPETGEMIGPEELLERGTITALSDYSYTFATTSDTDQRQQIIQSILNRDGDAKRDRIIREIRSSNHPIQPVSFYTQHSQEQVEFSGTCSYEQWQAMVSLLGPLMDEQFVKPESEDA